MDKDTKLNLKITATIWGIGAILLIIGLIFKRSFLWIGVLGAAGLAISFALIYALIQTLRHKGTFGKNFIVGLALISAELPAGW
jgi:hypothetical protein